MINLYNSEAECCGCGACEAICPRSNIKMTPLKEGGYYYPEYLGDTNCINCHLCLKVCPMKQTSDLNEESFLPVFFAGFTKDEKLWESSSSGGAFTEICNAKADEKPVVFGARWEGFDVVMDYDDKGRTGVFRKSKYVAVNPNHSYQKVKDFLVEGRYVIYSGSPCQINGLYAYLSKHYDKLLTIDFACHGQGSPMVFKKWISYLESKYGKALKTFRFREKKVIGDHINSNCTAYEFADGTLYITTRDYYHHAYVKGVHMRKSCENCKFAANRRADITLADFKNVSEGWPEMLSKRNISTIVCNTSKGYNAVNTIKSMTMKEPDVDFVLKYNPKLITALNGNQQRDEFMDDIIAGVEIMHSIKKYCKILPSEWIEYNCSVKLAKRVKYITVLIDKFAQLFYKFI